MRRSLDVGSLSLIVLLTTASPAGAAEFDLGTCDITGTDGPDIIDGTGQGEVICGLGGDDTIVGHGGTVIGPPDGDIIWGGSGDDRLVGRAQL